MPSTDFLTCNVHRIAIILQDASVTTLITVVTPSVVPYVYIPLSQAAINCPSMMLSSNDNDD